MYAIKKAVEKFVRTCWPYREYQYCSPKSFKPPIPYSPFLYVPSIGTFFDYTYSPLIATSRKKLDFMQMVQERSIKRDKTVSKRQDDEQLENDEVVTCLVFARDGIAFASDVFPCDGRIGVAYPEKDLFLAKCSSCGTWYFTSEEWLYTCTACGFYDGARTYSEKFYHDEILSFVFENVLTLDKIDELNDLYWLSDMSPGSVVKRYGLRSTFQLRSYLRRMRVVDLLEARWLKVTPKSPEKCEKCDSFNTVGSRQGLIIGNYTCESCRWTHNSKYGSYYLKSSPPIDKEDR